jgi:hypothetical protein
MPVHPWFSKPIGQSIPSHFTAPPVQNKNKSKVVQKYVQQLQASSQPSQKQKRLEEPSRKDKKKAEEEQARELASLFALAIKQPKVPLGVDPKSILCEYFRHGQCTKGFKCKFSHDLSVERKGPKLDLYQDKRDGKDGEDEGMEDWDQETLEKAIAEKHGNEYKNRPTEIVCRYFLDAVEKRQYGWFWSCPNGKDCKYRHALPPGYVLKSQMKQMLDEEAANKKSVEEIIEEERAKVDAKTPITDDVFKVWKAGKVAAKRKVAADNDEERRRKGIFTGREIFAEEGFIATDDIGATDAFEREVDEEAEIARVQAKALLELERTRANGGDAAEPADASDGKATAAAAGGVELTQAEAEELFGESDEDELEDDMLEELAGDLEKSAVVSG